MSNFTLISFVELVVLAIAVYEDLYSSLYMQIFEIHTLLRIPHTIHLLKRERCDVVASFFAGISVSLFTAFLLGVFDLHDWLLTCVLIGTSETSLLALKKMPKASKYAIIGMVLGCIPFPLDWPVYWKETPIASILFASIGNLFGNIVDN